MRAKFAKSTWLVAIVAAILLLVASPGIAAASMEMTDENCDSNPCQKGAAIPLYCMTSDCPLTNCFWESTVTGAVLCPRHLTQNEDTYLAWSPTSLTPETSLNPKKPLQRTPTQELASPLYTKYYCRNCLGSEEPPLV